MPINLWRIKIIFSFFLFFIIFTVQPPKIINAAATTCIKATGNNVLCSGYLRCPVGNDIYCCDPGADLECQNLQKPIQPECTSNSGAACHLASDTCTKYYGNTGELGCPQFQRCGANCSASVNPFACVNIDNPEFHSLRPYQASPCSTEIVSPAKFCGNDLTLHEKVTVSYPGSEQYLTGAGCVTSGGTVTCNYSVPVEKEITLNLDVANLPIMGNTENVPNSTTSTGDVPILEDKDKVNGYVSWYLNGIQNRAEDGSNKNNDYNTVNLSGPINKLMPSVMLEAQRIQTIDNAVANTNHNQIVVCASKKYVLGPIGWLLGLVEKAVPKECYAGNGTAASDEYRLKNWSDGKLSKLSTFFNWIGTNVWNKRYPPLPWQFSSEIYYQKAYNEWRGKTCAIVPVINKLVCGDIPVISPTREWADLYSYIPLSGTEDLPGKIEIEKPPAITSYSSNGIDVSGISFNTNKPSILFFPHMQESTDLANVLQDTFVSSSEKGNKKGPATNVAAPASCTTVDVRSNKGDKLFATNLVGTLNYTAAFSCKFNAISTCSGSCNIPNERECRNAGGKTGTGSCSNGRHCCNLPGSTPPPPPPPQTCEKDVSINLSTLSYTPKAEDLWSQLVAGPQSIFKRIFPKTNTAGSVGQIKDMPGTTSITYSGGGVTQSTADLKFPHIGSISEYFLKGIQTALRPKGYGEPITFNTSSTTNVIDTFGDICAVATKYNIPCCQLQGIQQVETGGGKLVRNGTCNTKNGTFSCCNGNVCGPAQINCGQYNGFTGNDKIDVCSTVGAAELAARAMLLKLCQADGHCTSYDWSVWGTYVMQNYKIEYGDYTAAGYFYGVNNCSISGCSQLRWGTSKGYCDSVKSFCNTGSILPEVPYNLAYCMQCRDEMVASGYPTFQCTGE